MADRRTDEEVNQPAAREWRKANLGRYTRDGNNWISVTDTEFDAMLEAFAAQQSAAKDAELRQRDDDDRVVQEHTNSIIEKYEADLLAAERERDSLREQVNSLTNELRDKDILWQQTVRALGTVERELAALKAGKDEQ